MKVTPEMSMKTKDRTFELPATTRTGGRLPPILDKKSMSRVGQHKEISKMKVTPEMCMKTKGGSSGSNGAHGKGRDPPHKPYTP